MTTALKLLFVLLFLAAFSIVLLASRKSPEERTLQARIADIRNPRRSLRLEDNEAELEDEDIHLDLAARLSGYLRRYSFSATLERLLLEADSPATVGAVALHSLVWGAALGLPGMLQHSLTWATVGAALGGLVPLLRLRLKRRKRLNDATIALPDAVDLMARALRSGHSMVQTIELVSEQAAEPLRGEFGRVFQQQRLGVQLREVLTDMGNRLPSRDLQFLITAILVQRETGGDLAVVLDRTAALLRERVQLGAQVRVHTAQGRLTGWILSLLPVVLLGAMMLFSPNYAHVLFVDPIGKKLLYAGAALIAIGGLVIRRIVDVEV